MRALTSLLLAMLIASGCSGGSLFSRLDQTLANGDCPGATALIDAHPDGYGSNGQLLYLLDAAMVTLQCGDLDAARDYFQRADDLAERLWTESISRQALSMLTNDAVLPYAGEDFERVMIHLMAAIAYLMADEPDEALVEARRLDTLLAIYNDAYEKKNVYKEDAFARYLSGVLHEAAGEWDEAFIDYRRAAEVYRGDYRNYGVDPPEMLTEDLLRSASVVGRSAEIANLVQGTRIDPGSPPEAASDSGRVVFITFAGYAPQKVEDMVVVPTPHGPIGMAFPRMVVTPPHCGRGRLELYGGEDRFFESELALVEDVNRIAVKNLDDRRGRILARAVARAAAKQVVIHGLAHSTNHHDDQRAIEAILNLVNILIVERADTRSWRTLPGQIYMTRLQVPPGEYTVGVAACGHPVADLGVVRVSPGATRFLFRDLRYPVSATEKATP